MRPSKLKQGEGLSLTAYPSEHMPKTNRFLFLCETPAGNFHLVARGDSEEKAMANLVKSLPHIKKIIKRVNFKEEIYS